MKQRPFWYLLNLYGWVVLGMSIVTAILIRQPWEVLLGVVGYLLALLVDLLGGRSLGRTGAMRLAQAEQENRELRAEQGRLIGAIRELTTQNQTKATTEASAQDKQLSAQNNSQPSFPGTTQQP
jgi:ABC-type transport system involved in cytochrome bd biosynthesis fused ATPase/permease subunit